MPQGDKSSFIDKQKPQSDHIETGCEKKRFSATASEGKALAGASKQTAGDKRRGSGRSKKEWLVVGFSLEPAVFALRLGNAN